MTELAHTHLQELAENIDSAIDDYSVKLHKDEPRTHLGISEIGEECKRKLYYKFRWFAFEEFNGRMRRLFARGHREEERYVSYLEGIGCKVYRFENPVLNHHPESDDLFLSSTFNPGDGLVEDVTGLEIFELKAKEKGLKRKQFCMSGVMGHYGGSCDGVVVTPWYPDPFIGEFKTHNTKSFCHYIDKGLQISKPKHFDQMCGYGEKMQIQYGLYFPENKNDDDIKTTCIKLDWNRGKELEKKAEEIILATEPPPRISENPAFFNCKTCFAKDICHNEAIPVKNCRSCKNSVPVENAEWNCKQWASIIPKETIAKGCDKWLPI